jgi:hypothetical protein
MKTSILCVLLFALSGCSKSAPVEPEQTAAQSVSEDGIADEAKSIDEAADEAAAIVEEDANEEIKASQEAQPEIDEQDIAEDPKEGE